MDDEQPGPSRLCNAPVVAPPVKKVRLAVDLPPEPDLKMKVANEPENNSELNVEGPVTIDSRAVVVVNNELDLPFDPFDEDAIDNWALSVVASKGESDTDDSDGDDLGMLQRKEGEPKRARTAQECLYLRQRLAEYHEIIRIYGVHCRRYNFLAPVVTPVVLNVVAAASVGLPLDLRKVITVCRNVEYNPTRFAPCVMRIRKPRSTCLIFVSGRMIVSGCKSETDSYIAVRRFVRILHRKVDPGIRHVASYEIQNMSASCTLPFGITLHKLAACVAQDCKQMFSFEPELFPGLVWRLTEPKARIVMFTGGAILFTGLKSEEQLQKAFELIYPLCRYCRRES